MNRTRKLMTCVTASLLVAGTQQLAMRAADTRAAAAGQDVAVKQGAAKDPQLEKISDEIFSRLEKTTVKEAMTLEQLTGEFPKLTRDQIQEALKQLVNDGELQRTGTGEAGAPYEYFERTSHTG